MDEVGEALEPIELDGVQHQGSEQFYSRDGYMVDLLDERWRLSKDIDLPIGDICKIFPGNNYTLRQVFAFYAKHSSPSHVQNLLMRFAHYLKALGGAEVFSVESVISYRASLDKPQAWYLSTVRVLMRQWARLGYPGIPAETLVLFKKLRIKGNEKGRAVQSQCPDEGPLTDNEMQGVVESTTHCFAANVLSLTEAAMLMTFAMTGRRPSQVSALKLKDLITLEGKYFINFPRAKQRSMGWRSSFKKFSVIEDLWLILNEQAKFVRSMFATILEVNVISAHLDGELPLFPNLKEDLALVRESEFLKSDRLHIPARGC